MNFLLVDGGQLDLRTEYNPAKKQWKLERKLFEYENAHNDAYCIRKAQEDAGHVAKANEIFWCYHALNSLYRLMIEQLRPEDLGVATENEARRRRSYLCSLVETTMPAVPQILRVFPAAEARSLEVTWESGESNMASKHANAHWHVHLHEANDLCRARFHDLIRFEGKLMMLTA